jgi:hypothetical protein
MTSLGRVTLPPGIAYLGRLVDQLTVVWESPLSEHQDAITTLCCSTSLLTAEERHALEEYVTEASRRATAPVDVGGSGRPIPLLSVGAFLAGTGPHAGVSWRHRATTPESWYWDGEHYTCLGGRRITEATVGRPIATAPASTTQPGPVSPAPYAILYCATPPTDYASLWTMVRASTVEVYQGTLQPPRYQRIRQLCRPTSVDDDRCFWWWVVVAILFCLVLLVGVSLGC